MFAEVMYGIRTGRCPHSHRDLLPRVGRAPLHTLAHPASCAPEDWQGDARGHIIIKPRCTRKSRGGILTYAWAHNPRCVIGVGQCIQSISYTFVVIVQVTHRHEVDIKIYRNCSYLRQRNAAHQGRSHPPRPVCRNHWA